MPFLSKYPDLPAGVLALAQPKESLLPLRTPRRPHLLPLSRHDRGHPRQVRAANMCAADSQKIIADAKGDLDKARDLVIDLLAAKHGADEPHNPAGSSAATLAATPRASTRPWSTRSTRRSPAAWRLAPVPR